MKRRLPSREEIEAEATRLFMQEQYVVSDITPEREELSEGGYIERARRNLMSGRPAEDISVASSTIMSQQESYVMDMASELGLVVLPKREYEKEHKELARLRWQFEKQATRKKTHPVAIHHKKTTKAKPKPKPVTKRSLLRRIRAAQKKKGMAHIEKDLGIKTDIHGNIKDPVARKILGSLIRKGDVFSPRESYYAEPGLEPGTVRKGKLWTGKKWVKHRGTIDVEKRESPAAAFILQTPAGKREEIKRVSLREPLDIGSAIRGRPAKVRLPVAKPVGIRTPAEVILGEQPKGRVQIPSRKQPKKPKRRKRKKARVERAGKTMRRLRKIDGVKVFSFPDHVWKVREK